MRGPGTILDCSIFIGVSGRLYSLRAATPGWFLGFSLSFLLCYKHEIGDWWSEGNLQEQHSRTTPVKKQACVPWLFTLLILLEGDVLRLCFCTMLYICKVLQKTLIKYVSFFSFSPVLAFLSLLSPYPLLLSSFPSPHW